MPATDSAKRMQDFNGLADALQSGDISNAQDAFTTLQKDLQAGQPNGKTSPLLDPNTPVGKDFQAIQDALKSGDIKAAQDAFSSLRQDIRSVRHAHGHHHHKQVDNDNDADNGESDSVGGTSNSGIPAPPHDTSATLNVTA